MSWPATMKHQTVRAMQTLVRTGLILQPHNLEIGVHGELARLHRATHIRFSIIAHALLKKIRFSFHRDQIHPVKRIQESLVTWRGMCISPPPSFSSRGQRGSPQRLWFSSFCRCAQISGSTVDLRRRLSPVTGRSLITASRVIRISCTSRHGRMTCQALANSACKYTSGSF